MIFEIYGAIHGQNVDWQEINLKSDRLLGALGRELCAARRLCGARERANPQSTAASTPSA
jgi:hypothetical protein